MAEAKASATQVRVINLFQLQTAETYAHAAQILKTAGLPADGCPEGKTWRDVKKMSDDELRAALPAPVAVEKTVEVPVFKKRTWGDAIAAAKARRDLNEKLRAAGYRWSKEYTTNNMNEDAEEVWVLYAPTGEAVSLAAAKRAIGIEE